MSSQGVLNDWTQIITSVPHGIKDSSHSFIALPLVEDAAGHAPAWFDRSTRVCVEGLWQSHYSKVNLRSQRGAQANGQLKQGSGAIVNNSSAMGLVAHGKATAYVTSKHGLIGMTRSAALEHVKDNIRINAICPGNVETPMFDPMKKDLPEVFQGMVEATPIGRFAQPDEIANAVLWLCSDGASYCTGHALVVDGCFTIQ